MSNDDIYLELQRDAARRAEQAASDRAHRTRMDKNAEFLQEQLASDRRYREREESKRSYREKLHEKGQNFAGFASPPSKLGVVNEEVKEVIRRKRAQEESARYWSEVYKRKRAERHRRGDFKSYESYGALWPLMKGIDFCFEQLRRVEYSNSWLKKWRLLTWPCTLTAGITLTAFVYYWLYQVIIYIF